jgi:hypothetical protein
VAPLEGGDVRALLIGEKTGVAVAVVVGEAQLGSGVRALAAHDQARGAPWKLDQASGCESRPGRRRSAR